MAVAMRLASMNSTSNSTNARESDSFTRKLAIVFLLVVNAALGIALWFRVDAELPLLLSTVFADATLGMVAGFGVKTVFRKWNLIAQYLVVFASVVVGMVLLGSLTKFVLGIGPLRLGREASAQFRQLSFDNTLPSQLRALDFDPKTLIDFGRMDASDTAHLAGSLLLAALSLMAWRQPARQAIEVEPLGHHAQVEVEPRDVGVSLAPEGSNGGGARVHPPVTWFRSPAPGAAPTPRSRSKNRIKPFVPPEAKPKRRSRSGRMPKIQLAVVEEHRCPYCLDPVARNDARGVKECDVCHTLHHADCWAITGFCQVPHLNS
ncbi:MAG: hypothetical protein IT314_10360 [Anaerolineales bacterium]|nr:hypothetical protein [Anaerolineales bacterium]